jgi:ribosome-binding factor A
MPTRRQQRVAHRMRAEIADLIDKRAQDPRLHGLTVMAVEISPDFRQAFVYVSALVGVEGSREALAGLEHAKGFFRHELAARLELRVVPDLIFRWDASLETGDRISRILDELAQSDDDT